MVRRHGFEPGVSTDNGSSDLLTVSLSRPRVRIHLAPPASLQSSSRSSAVVGEEFELSSGADSGFARAQCYLPFGLRVFDVEERGTSLFFGVRYDDVELEYNHLSKELGDAFDGPSHRSKNCYSLAKSQYPPSGEERLRTYSRYSGLKKSIALQRHRWLIAPGHSRRTLQVLRWRTHRLCH
jgi:hypothetical protein